MTLGQFMGYVPYIIAVGIILLVVTFIPELLVVVLLIGAVYIVLRALGILH